MSKTIRIAGLVFVFLAVFVTVTALIRVKQEYLGHLEKPVLGGLVEENEEAAEESTPPADQADVPDTEGRRVGRALFDNPSPYTAQEISDLMVSLEQRQTELDERAAELGRREAMVQTMMDDLERLRANVMGIAQEVAARVDPADGGAAAEAEAGLGLNQENLQSVADLLSRMDPLKAAQVLQARPADQGAAILLEIKDERKATAILQSFSQDSLAAITDALLAQRGDEDPEG